jgi:hypothetical protein
MSGETHSIIHVQCDGCAAVDQVTLLEHPRDSKQHEAVAKAHHQLAEEHADETGHHVEVGQSEGEPESARKVAQSLAEDFEGADPADFEREVMA